MKKTLDEVVLREVSRMCMRLTKRRRESGFVMVEMKARESEIIRKIWGADEEFWVMMFSRKEGWPGVRL